MQQHTALLAHRHECKRTHLVGSAESPFDLKSQRQGLSNLNRAFRVSAGLVTSLTLVPR